MLLRRWQVGELEDGSDSACMLTPGASLACASTSSRWSSRSFASEVGGQRGEDRIHATPDAGSFGWAIAAIIPITAATVLVIVVKWIGEQIVVEPQGTECQQYGDDGHNHEGHAQNCRLIFLLLILDLFLFLLFGFLVFISSSVGDFCHAIGWLLLSEIAWLGPVRWLEASHQVRLSAIDLRLNLFVIRWTDTWAR